MGLFSGLFGKKKDNQDVNKLAELIEDNSNELYGLPEGYKPQEVSEASDEVKARLEKLLPVIDSMAAPKSRVSFKPVRAATTIFDNRLGGVPYMPKDAEYPTVSEGEHQGKPLRFLAQINFAKLPPMEGFPEKGILQFFVGCDGDDIIGMDFDDGFNQNRFRVIYHSNIVEDVSQLYSANDMPSFDSDDFMFPFKGKFLLRAAEPEQQPISASDYNFQKVVLAAYNKVFGTSYDSVFGGADSNSIYQHDHELCDLLYETRSVGGAAVGGYPYFTQSDPREYGEEPQKCEIMLFQLDSEGDGADEIIWGDCGVGNFFISRENLAALDFSKVLYNWDCC